MASELSVNYSEVCLREEIFPHNWKKLVLFPKVDKPPEEEASRHPICLWDTMRKMMEKAVCNRLLPILKTVMVCPNTRVGLGTPAPHCMQ